MPRLFTGLEIPADVAQSLSMMRGGLPGARWIDPENYHLTLRFIGDIDDALAREIAVMLGRVQRGIANVEEIGAERKMRPVLFENAKGQQARSLGSMNAFAEIGGGKFFPVDGQLRLRGNRLCRREMQKDKKRKQNHSVSNPGAYAIVNGQSNLPSREF